MPRHVCPPVACLPHNLSRRRREMKLTQAQLAARAGIKASTLGAYEEGRAEPSIASLLALSSVLDCSLEFLVTPA